MERWQGRTASLEIRNALDVFEKLSSQYWPHVFEPDGILNVSLT